LKETQGKNNIYT